MKNRNLFTSIMLALSLAVAVVIGSNVSSSSPAPGTPPAPTIVNEKEAQLGQAVRHIFKGHQVTTFLTSYDSSSDSYDGHVQFPMSIKARKLIPIGKGETIDAEEQIALVLLVKGLRPLVLDPDTGQPLSNYEFQFVRPGESTQPLIDIINRNIAERNAAQ